MWKFVRLYCQGTWKKYSFNDEVLCIFYVRYLTKLFLFVIVIPECL